MTNDARDTRQRRRKTTNETNRLQSSIIDYLLRFVPPSNITLLESPPLLSYDIYPYNKASFTLAGQRQLHFGPTLIGEQHLWRDGVHVAKRFRPLLLKTVAAAACNVNPNRHFRLARPPCGIYGPWEAPFGCGMGPPQHPPPSLNPQPILLWNDREFPPLNARDSNVAAAPPYYFRDSAHLRAAGIQSGTDRNIRWS